MLFNCKLNLIFILFLTKNMMKSGSQLFCFICFQLLSLLAYILCEVSSCDGKGATEGYFKFVTLFAFATTTILYFLLLFKLHRRILRCDCVNWPFIVSACYLKFFFNDESNNVDTMLAHRLRRWPNIVRTLEDIMVEPSDFFNLFLFSSI